MKYMLLVYSDEKAASESDKQQCREDSARFAQELHANGQYVAAAPLQPTATATSVRRQDGRRVVTDGPFAETREQLGGYFVIEAADLDVAIDIAGRLPAGRWGTVEIRPIIEMRSLPNVDSAAAYSIKG